MFVGGAKDAELEDSGEMFLLNVQIRLKISLLSFELNKNLGAQINDQKQNVRQN
jgi:hypothetical protein